MAKKKIKFEISSGNVYADLGLPNAEERYKKSMERIKKMKKKKKENKK